ncbi:carbamoyl-phosphate synthase large subunit [Candidatus Haliotispira prima]|uniref:Carbamoyl phosphate synthase large chain n=1 Tax=Candidatus Haliotispira prima TaxID=3034016 RepID=A0ABY8MGL2_9SPIO|nr:carbamoyl-phosphate synthase large subunit [Candidatus Haliotispira prima]
MSSVTKRFPVDSASSPADFRNILVIGAGPIVIGQACEFDYSGSQACRVLKEVGFRVVLINSNPATIMTDPDLAHRTYIEPIRPNIIEQIISDEKIEAVLPTLGGQTALNCAVELDRLGILQRHNCKLIGITVEAIRKAEDRRLFDELVRGIGLRTPKNQVVNSVSEAYKALAFVGLPAIIRPSFTLGGGGGGVAYNHEEFERIVRNGLATSPTHQIQIDESLLGWKEYELEVVRDKNDNCIIVCSIENVDPMGVHTGDSITVAPALTLTDKEYQQMRDAAFAILRAVGVETGGSNVQFTVNPADGELMVIEMNPRVSRSSALASKATGFPIAKVAALLAVGYTLEQIPNTCTGGVTPISFEPTLDYVVTKIPRFNFEKFPESPRILGSSMKAVGEVMAIGRNFLESLQKAYQSLEEGHSTLSEQPALQGRSEEEISNILAKAFPERLLNIVQAIREGVSTEQIHRVTHFDPWYLEQFTQFVALENELKTVPVDGLDGELLLRVAQHGFSQKRIAELKGLGLASLRRKYRDFGLERVYKRIDTCAAEFASSTSYFYSTWERRFLVVGDPPPPVGFSYCEARPGERDKIIILGSGPNRIGQGIEFDYVCVQGIFGLQRLGYEVIIVNCNPETVSTDYDIADRLYLESVELEYVLDIVAVEQSRGTLKGVIVQYGGQTPLKLARGLEAAGVPLLGPSPQTIDLTEDREEFSRLLSRLDITQAPHGTAMDADIACTVAGDLGYPVLVRPSFVLGGAKMRILHSETELLEYLGMAQIDYSVGPLLIDSYLEMATELDVDAIYDGHRVHIAGIMEHIEEAGIHSGDSACSLPPFSIAQTVLDKIVAIVERLAAELDAKGLINMQFALANGEIYLLEVNPRASRTTPFVAKATGLPVAQIGAQIMVGKTLDEVLPPEIIAGTGVPHYAVKEVVLPFRRFPESTTLLGPEMKSTGEVMGISTDFAEAFSKAYLAGDQHLPKDGLILFVLQDIEQLQVWQELALQLHHLEFSIGLLATRGIEDRFSEEGIPFRTVPSVEAQRPNVLDIIIDDQVVLILNQTAKDEAHTSEHRKIRRIAVAHDIPYTTTLNGAQALVKAISWYHKNEVQVLALQDVLPAINLAQK